MYKNYWLEYCMNNENCRQLRIVIVENNKNSKGFLTFQLKYALRFSDKKFHLKLNNEKP